MNTQDTICAIATAQGGAISIIRISGRDAINITDKIFYAAGNKHTPLAERPANTITFGLIKNGNDEIIDEVLVSIFRAPHSYTGEDSVEISCHGSSYILQQVMQLLINNGCRAAGPGEYTQRAFLNGKMDLSQAEAVADLIAATSAATHRMAMDQMRGGFSRELSILREKLLHLTSLMELELDFSDHEELEFADRSELKDIASQIERVISHLTNSFSMGNALKNGVPVAIVGETNAGKSTLLNTLLNEERAIVSDIHGTTRDVIEDTINLEGITFRFIDTAGIRETTDAIETLGIERSFQKLDQANIVLWVIDATCAEEQFKQLSDQIIPRCKDKHLIIVLNKFDLLDDSAKELLTNSINNKEGDNSSFTTILGNVPKECAVMPLSAKNKDGLQGLQKQLISYTTIPDMSQNDIVVSNIRHYEALKHALDAIHRVQDGLNVQLSGDLISEDLRQCLFHLAEIVGGEITTDEVLGNIFKHFCIGK
ncbi:tRNA uridine-5-carboxymethylaminomethyl(34) synthesis GTPase MnmE [uncultured Prevotella sp.]|uniref:tRNA uridine-5-carboxymethylaminomethyl(34) synthesis GTPase MnmE n=1 Tax=uncultured Prevotella sp. TaxID=159272 RepID=UPI0025EFF29E|nr:tRNA uridine-5-carboxymethylaminomethyl(34) synthesis GTPase MnmE [uncultured Prevotella sp.]